MHSGPSSPLQQKTSTPGGAREAGCLSEPREQRQLDGDHADPERQLQVLALSPRHAFPHRARRKRAGREAFADAQTCAARPAHHRSGQSTPTLNFESGLDRVPALSQGRREGQETRSGVWRPLLAQTGTEARWLRRKTRAAQVRAPGRWPLGQLAPRRASTRLMRPANPREDQEVRRGRTASVRAAARARQKPCNPIRDAVGELADEDLQPSKAYWKT